MTPCESTPRRLAKSRLSAVTRASSGARPSFSKHAVQKIRSVSGQIRDWLMTLLRLRPFRPFDVVNENPVANASGFARPGQLERDEFAVIAHDRVGRLVAGVIGEVREPL